MSTTLLRGLFFDLEYLISTFLRNVGKLLANYLCHIPKYGGVHSLSRENLKSDNIVVLVMTPYSFVGGYQHFEGIY
jgi:hypothetical protein